MESIKNIRAFLVVAQTKSFTEASNKLFVTQPAITKRISQMEEFLNDKLFYRVGNTVQLTSTGKKLLPYAIELISIWDKIQLKFQDMQDDIIGELNIISSYQIGLDFLPKVLELYVKKYPKVEIRVDSTYSLPIIKEINKLNADIGLITINEAISEDIEVNIFEKKRVVAVIAKNHPYWQLDGDMIKNLNNIPVLSTSPGNKHYEILHEFKNKHKINSREISDVNMLVVIKRLVEAGVGWSIINEDMVSDKLQEIKIIDNLGYISNAYIYNKRVELSRPAKAFIEMCNQYPNLT
ncbi:LysR family transcriptional regulator [Francisella sp. 19X1-34]|uniref:LysR family transcriptional regulator n=1 Tax=Francisella sp. 19X1-34 TaxID=3087177 RepID=UPI002E34176C|nr:LysR family transcriptional regulator [Francisella sp. 19X1-34]MED7789485.1 LysR family transcriptional regulator [Francisella sp. 19X1-34]